MISSAKVRLFFESTKTFKEKMQIIFNFKTFVEKTCTIKKKLYIIVYYYNARVQQWKTSRMTGGNMLIWTMYHTAS